MLPPEADHQTNSAPTEPIRRPRLIRYLSVLAIYLIAFLILYILETAGEIGKLAPTFVRQLWDSSAWYQKIASASPRHVISRYTTLLSLDTKTLPASLLRNVCDEERELLSRLINKTAAAHPSMIVLDFVFLADSCDTSKTGPGSGTADLIAALEKTAQDIPVIVGQEATIDADGELAPQPLVALGKNIRTGLVILNEDIRKVPLQWQRICTIAFQAARLYRAASEADSLGEILPEGQDLTAKSRVQSCPGEPSPVSSGQTSPDALELLDNLAHGSQPYTSFIAEDSFPKVDAMSVLCDAAHRSEKWQACGEKEGERGELERLRGRIVVVGWEQGDVHHTILGPMPGFVIHANYIESLLDEHYLKAISIWWQLAISAVWFLLMEIPFWRIETGTAKPLAIALVVWIFVSILVYYVAVVNWGYYTALFAPSLIALLLRSTHRWLESRKNLR
jgi:hypothetical protein